MTFVLVSVVYAVAIGEPSFGVVGPFAVGLSLFAMVFAGKLLPSTSALKLQRALPMQCSLAWPSVHTSDMHLWSEW